MNDTHRATENAAAPVGAGEPNNPEDELLRQAAAEHFDRKIPKQAIVIEPDKAPWNQLTDSQWERESGIEDWYGARILMLDTAYAVLRDAEVEEQLRDLALKPMRESD